MPFFPANVKEHKFILEVKGAKEKTPNRHESVFLKVYAIDLRVVTTIKWLRDRRWYQCL